MKKNIVYDAASLSLVGHGMTPSVANAIVTRTRMSQESEWGQIMARCERGEVSRIYIVVRRPEEGISSDFIARNPAEINAVVYAPDKQDNIRHVIDFVSQGPDIGAGPGDDLTEETEIGYYAVSAFDVGPDVKKAVRI